MKKCIVSVLTIFNVFLNISAMEIPLPKNCNIDVFIDYTSTRYPLEQIKTQASTLCKILGMNNSSLNLPLLIAILVAIEGGYAESAKISLEKLISNILKTKKGARQYIWNTLGIALIIAANRAIINGKDSSFIIFFIKSDFIANHLPIKLLNTIKQIVSNNDIKEEIQDLINAREYVDGFLPSDAEEYAEYIDHFFI